MWDTTSSKSSVWPQRPPTWWSRSRCVEVQQQKLKKILKECILFNHLLMEYGPSTCTTNLCVQAYRLITLTKLRW